MVAILSHIVQIIVLAASANDLREHSQSMPAVHDAKGFDLLRVANPLPASHWVGFIHGAQKYGLELVHASIGKAMALIRYAHETSFE
jgi:hypothetical protein